MSTLPPPLISTPPPAPAPAHSLFKKMLQDSSLYSIALIGQRLAAFILVPIVTKRLHPSDYGVLDLLEQIGVIVSVLLGLNFTRALGFFYFQEGANKSKVVGTTLSGAILVGSLAGMIGWLLAEPLSRAVYQTPEYAPYLRLLFISLPLGFLLEAGSSWLRAEDRVRLSTITSLLRTGLQVVGTIVLVAVFNYRVGGVLGASIIAGAVTSILIGTLGIRFHGIHFDWTLFVRMLKFSIPLSLSALAMFIIHFGDRFILPHYRPLDDLGLYAVAYKIGMLLTPVQSSFEAYWGAQVYQIVKRDDAGQVFARTFTYFLLAMSYTALGLLVAAKPVLRTFTTPAYFGAAQLVPIILLAYYVRALSDFFRFAWLAQGLPSHDAIGNWVTAAVSLAAYFLLIPPFGATGAAFATLIAFLSAALISFVWSRRILPYRLEVARVLKVVAITGGLSGVHFLLTPGSQTLEIAQGILLLLAFAVLLFVSRFFSPGEKTILYSFPKRLKLKLAGA